MLYIKAFHIIAMVAWFAGLFYLPRLFVYHVESTDKISIERFKVMERRLYLGIMWPASILTTVLGILLLIDHYSYYLKAPWMHTKLLLVVFLWGFHLWLGHYVKRLRLNKSTPSSLFFRILNELPTVFLICIVLLVVVKPF